MKIKFFKIGFLVLLLVFLLLMVFSYVYVVKVEIFDDSVIVVYKENVSKVEKMCVCFLVGVWISDVNCDEVDDCFFNFLNGCIVKLEFCGKFVKDVIEILKKNFVVKIVELNFLYCKVLVFNDFFYGDLWGLNNIG